MRRLLPRFEHRTHPLLPPHRFALRLAYSGAVALIPVGASLLVGMAGFRVFEGQSWVDAFLQASMLLGGMGPTATFATRGGKIFAGVYALWCGLVVIVAAGIILAPMAHRVLHKFHVEGREK